MKLSPNWRRVPLRFSFNGITWALAFVGWWQSNVAPDLKAEIGTTRALWIIGALLALGAVGSFIEQPRTRSPNRSRTVPQPNPNKSEESPPC